jgi:predicted O-methyltransferase YrrM
MSTSTLSSPGRSEPAGVRRNLSRRVSHHVWHALTPSAEGPERGRALETVRRILETRLHAARLRERLPELAGHRDARDRLWARLLPVYRRFVAHVAPPSSSMSLEVAGFLADLCEQRRPARILEVGTGFATAVLRRLGEPASWQPEIVSADDDPERLARTRRFLAEESLPPAGLVSWDEFCSARESGFDLVVHELGAGSGAPLAVALDCMTSGGLLLLDGAHRPAAERIARRLLAEAGAEQWSLRSLTLDCFGRHALLAQR